MPSLTIKNIPEDLYIQLKRQAKLNRRSLNNEVILCIERAIRSRKIQPEDFLYRARKLRKKTDNYPITDDEFNIAKTAGRL